MKNVPAVVGLVLGMASATVGVRAIVPGFPLRPWHVLIVGAIVLASATSRSRRVPRPRPSATVGFLILFALLCVATDLWNGQDLGGDTSFTEAIYPLYFAVGYVATRMTVRHRTDAVIFLTLFSMPAIPAAIAALAQLASADAARVILWIAPSEGLSNRLELDKTIRATSFVGHWTGSGMYFCAVLAATGAAVLLTPKSRPVNRWLWLATAAATAGALASATISVVATAMAIFVTVVLVGRFRALVLFGSAGVVAGVCSFVLVRPVLAARVDQQTGSRPAASTSSSTPTVQSDGSWIPSTLSYRYRIWSEQTVPTILERPLTGWGADVFGSHVRPTDLVWNSAESQWLGIALSFGFPALLVFVLLLAAMGSTLVRHRTPMSAPVATLFVMSVLSAFIVPVFTNRGLPVALWILIGVVVALSPYRDGVRIDRSENAVTRTSS